MITAPTPASFDALDNAEIGRRHWLTVITSGMGFFTDAYDLFIIGTVTVLLTPIFHLSTNQISLLNSISLLSSVAGATILGRLMDRLGRKSVYGIEIALLGVGAIASALAWNFWSLLLFRVIVGFGVGGDYATSAVITAEYSNQQSRGRLVGTVFAMQGFGLVAGPLIASILLGSGVSSSLAWRLMLGFGAIPAFSVVYLRRRIKETPRFSLVVKGDVASATRAVEWVTESESSAPIPSNTSANTHTPLRHRLSGRPFARRLMGTAGAWLLMDVAFYGNSVSSPLILSKISPSGSLTSHLLIQLAIFTVAALPGYWVAVHLLDKLGRRRIQIQGFVVMTIAFGLIWVIPAASSAIVLFVALFAISYFFVEFGPNMTTFVYPTEIFPTSIRGAADGLSAASGKLGAFIGALLVPHLLNSVGLSGVMGMMAGVSLLGALLTIVALPEPKGLTLEEASCEYLTPSAPRSAKRRAHLTPTSPAH